MLRDLLRYIDYYGDILVAADVRVIDIYYAALTESEACSGLRAGGHVVLDLAVKRRYVDFGTQDRHRIGNAYIAENIVAVTLEDGMRLDVRNDVEVTLRSSVRTVVTLAADGEGIAHVDTGGDLDLHGSGAAYHADALTARAGILDDLALAVALRAGFGGLEYAERRA